MRRRLLSYVGVIEFLPNDADGFITPSEFKKTAWATLECYKAGIGICDNDNCCYGLVTTSTIRRIS